MIQNIYIKNFVLIDELSLDFNANFSCFTGETGAGKSIFIDALSLLCGARIQTSYIQKGKEQTVLEATIYIATNHPSYQMLLDQGYESEDNQFIITRTFDRDGKSSAKINHRNTTVAFLKQVLSNVIDIHSQHDSQYLLDSKNHLQLLDEFMSQDTLLKKMEEAYNTYHQIEKQLDQIKNEELNPDDLAFYEYQFAEIDQLQVKENEIENLQARQKEMQSYEKLVVHINHSLDFIQNSKYENLYNVHKELQHVDNDMLQDLQQTMLDAYYIVDEKYHDLQSFLSTLAFDENEFNAIQERLFDIQKIFRKYGNTYERVMQKREELMQKMDLFEHREAKIKEVENALEVAKQAFVDEALKVQGLRKKAAIRLEKLIMNELQDLHLMHAKFHIEFRDSFTKHGLDQIEFHVSMNKGEDLQPLYKVVSGGELSRLMLGLKTIFSRLQNIQTIIFDEIDTGVSGNVAYAIGKKMSKLAQDAQVFSITHLAAVAAWANEHYYVSKKVVNDKTLSVITMLDNHSRIEELASIASNSNSEQALQAAQELYDSCRSDT